MKETAASCEIGRTGRIDLATSREFSVEKSLALSREFVARAALFMSANSDFILDSAYAVYARTLLNYNYSF